MAATTPKDQMDKDLGRGVADTARQVADTVAGAAGEVTARLPEAASSTREAFDEANRMIHAGSDQTLQVVGALSIGFAAGLLVGGANRVLIMAALAPAALIGATYIERTNSGSPRSQGR